MTASQLVICPECGSKRIWLDGKRYINEQPVQRYLCRVCGYRFSDPNFSKEKSINNLQQTGVRQICVLDEKAKNLVQRQKSEALQENNKTKSNLVNYAIHLKKDGKSDATVETYTKLLRTLDKHGDLYDPESVKSVIAFHYKSNVTKRLAVCAYSSYLNFVGGQWQKPFYKRYDKLPKIPTTEQLNMLISHATTRMALILSMSKELGTRPIELTWLKTKDINLKNGTVNIISAKHCNARILKLKTKTLDMLKQHIQKYNLNQNDRLFTTSSNHISDVYHRHRNKLAIIRVRLGAQINALTRACQ
jgi:integrase